jgi:hypothetical protein
MNFGGEFYLGKVEKISANEGSIEERVALETDPEMGMGFSLQMSRKDLAGLGKMIVEFLEASQSGVHLEDAPEAPSRFVLDVDLEDEETSVAVKPLAPMTAWERLEGLRPKDVPAWPCVLVLRDGRGRELHLTFGLDQAKAIKRELEGYLAVMVGPAKTKANEAAN